MAGFRAKRKFRDPGWCFQTSPFHWGLFRLEICHGSPALLGPHTELLLRLCSLTVTVRPLFHKGGCVSSERRSGTTGWRWQLGGGPQSQVRTRGSWWQLLSPSSESPEARGPQLATGPQGTWSTDPQPAATTGAVLHLGWNRSLQGGHQEMPAT